MWEWIVLAGVVLSIIYVVKVRKDVDSGINVPENFTGQEKLAIWGLSFLSPIIFGAVFYYSLKSRLPKKAKYANNVSWVVFLLVIVVTIFVLPRVEGLI